MEESQSNVGKFENGDAFYEQIEAPKFVDLNAPDHFHPGDDRFWFCSRVGCDRRHEEEMDPEEIYQKFVLRVMAARSPNIRLRKALYRNDSSLRCPQSVPAKPSKAKVSRLDLISSMSKRLVDPKVRVKPVSKPVTTPNVKVKQSSAASKALTTPGKKKKIANPDVFRSVRNPKAAAMVVSKNNTVAKALVFHSPKKSGREKTSLELKTPIKTTGKKSGRAKTSSELKTPIRTLCEGMKKLEIGTARKNVLGYRVEGIDASRKQPRVREVKSRVFDGLLPQNRKALEAKSAEVSRKKIEDKSSRPQEGDHNNFTEMETERKSSPCSLDICSESKFITDLTPQPSFEETSVGGNVPIIQAPIEEDSNDAEEHGVGGETRPIASEFYPTETESNDSDENENEKEERRKVMLKKGRSETKETDDGNENEGGKAIESDKENTSASDDNREKNAGDTHKSATQKVSRTMSKKSKDSSTIITTKPAPTNPKPFRLRTDARRILKEANLEKKPQIGPLKEMKLGTRLPGETLQKKPHKSGQENGTSILKSSKERTGRKFAATPVKHTVSSQQKLVTSLQEHKAPQKLGNSLRETKSPIVRQKIARARGVAPGQLGVINETPETISRHKEPAKQSENGSPLTSGKNSASPASTPSFKQKKLTTIPKEPKFHTIHVPKSCTRRVA